MAQSLIQTQEQKLLQQQRLTQQQMLLVRLTEMPVAELEENVNAELDDNPALEAAPADEGHTCDDAPSDAMDDDGDTPSDDDSERADDIDKALESIASDDEMPATYKPGDTDNAEYEEMVYGDQDSFYDKLREQVGELDIDERQRYILEYIIGSLDDDGLLRKDIQAICDELEVYHNIECSPNDVRAMLSQLQTFDPPGIGAQSLQQCLLIQRSRKHTTASDMMTRTAGEITFYSNTIFIHIYFNETLLHTGSRHAHSSLVAARTGSCQDRHDSPQQTDMERTGHEVAQGGRRHHRRPGAHRVP